VIGVLAWGAGGFRDRSVQASLFLACSLLAVLPNGHPGLALVGAGIGLFLVFTVQSSLWLLDVVTQLEGSRQTQASLAVAEERLRFSRDVHDVLGRQLSTIAVQAELAATLARRWDPRAPQQILEVRETAHEALREARELARGYRPLDLHAEIDGAVSLLGSAGITATADLGGLPEAWHEPVARVIREAVTNVLRHSAATRVEMTYADRAVVITNDGAPQHETGQHETGQQETGPGGTDQHGTRSGTPGTGLAGLTEQLAPSGVTVTTDHRGDTFVVRAELAARPLVPTGVEL
jgi:two-component system sensor histidine kinase DesK